MTASALPASPRRREHAPREEYFAWVKDVFAGAPKSIKSRRYFYDRFLKHWPDLEAWFAEPLLVRLDLHDRVVHEPGKRVGPSQDTGPYIVYLSLAHGIPLDAAYVLSRNFNSLFNPNVAAGLGLDMGLFERHIERIVELGYRPVTGRSSLTWALSRLLLWRGDPDISAITYDDIVAFGEEISRYCAEVPEFRRTEGSSG
ncbi:hypothetical protein ACGFNU_49935 [Spirillospora sp. NPDC048911]|uniref:hypothetical protein n=1 Tax=Spirillospora sp. NPDC048911 TaxID=3364527 RepID=UPI0037230DE9